MVLLILIQYSSKDFLSGENGFPDKKYEKYIRINEEIKPNSLFSINLKIPQKNEKEDEKIDIKFNLKLVNDNLKELLLPCSFSFILCSLRIKIECSQYKLIIENNGLTLGTKFLEENEIINFNLECLNKNNKIDFKVIYRSNFDNEAKEPKLSHKNNSFSLKIENEYNKVNISEQKFSLKL